MELPAPEGKGLVVPIDPRGTGISQHLHSSLGVLVVRARQNKLSTVRERCGIRIANLIGQVIVLSQAFLECSGDAMLVAPREQVWFVTTRLSRSCSTSNERGTCWINAAGLLL